MLKRIIFFAYARDQGINEHMFNMVLAVNRLTDLSVVYDERIGIDRSRIERLKDSNIPCIDVSNLRQHIDTHFKGAQLVFHCQGFSHLLIALRNARPIDRIMITVHCFRNARWFGKWMALLTYLLFSKSVHIWHFLSRKVMEEYFWFRPIPSNTCIFPLGVEELFMSKSQESYILKDLETQETIDLCKGSNIVCIAQFQPWKRHIFLLRSLRAILKGGTYLILVGDGPLLKRVMNFSKRLGIRDHVIFTGNVPRKMVHYILTYGNVSVTSTTSETFGWCLLESFCMDVPIVTTNVGIADSIVRDGGNGYILKQNCREEKFLEKTKMALERLRNVDNSKSKHLFRWEMFGRNTVDCYNKLFSDGNIG